MLLMILLGLVVFLRVKGRARHVVQDGTNAVQRRQILRIDREYILEFIHCLLADAYVVIRRSARNVLGGVGGRQIETGIQQAWVEVLGLLKILDAGVVLPVLKGRYALIQQIAGLQLTASGHA